MKQVLKPLITISLSLTSLVAVHSQEINKKVVGDWIFHPNYTLSRNAKNYPGQKVEPPKSRFQRFKTLGEPIIFYEEAPAERITGFIEPSVIPQKEFSVELWLLNHVNLPVGSLIIVRGKSTGDQPAWLLGCYDDEVVFQQNPKRSSLLQGGYF